MKNSKFGIRNPKGLARGARIIRVISPRGDTRDPFGFLISNFEFFP